MSRWKSKGLIAAAAVSLVGFGLGAESAYADSSGSDYSAFGQYGEINRIGGFDASAFNTTYNQADLTGGDFLNPSGFAVDAADNSISSEDPSEPASDTTALWVLDRTSSVVDTSNTTSLTTWRLQKLDDLGHVLGSVTFTLNFPAGSTASKDHYAVDGLAVDQNTGQVYTEIDDLNTTSPTSQYPYEIISWSIVPTNPGPTGVLQAPNSNVDSSGLFSVDTNSPDGFAAPSIVASRSQLTSGPLGANIYSPQGLAVDDVDGQDQLAMVADGSKGLYFSTGNGTSATGPTVVQLIDTSGAVGQLGNYWSAATGVNNNSGVVAADPLADDRLAASYEAELGPTGIDSTPVSAANPHGGLTVLLDATNAARTNNLQGGTAAASNQDVVQLSPDLSSERILASQLNAPVALGGGSSLSLTSNTDGAAIATEGFGPPYEPAVANDGASPEIVPLDNGLYAADYADPVSGTSTDGTNDGSLQAPESSGQNAKAPSYWQAGLTAGTTPNIGMRLLNPAAERDGTLSNTAEPLTAVYDTLGDRDGNTCGMPVADESLAAGQNGTFFVLERGRDTSGAGFNASAATTGRQIIEYAPITGNGALMPVSTDVSAGVCPGPSGTFTVADANVNGGATVQAASTTNPLTIRDHDTVLFDAGSIDYPAVTTDADGGELDNTSEAHAVPFDYEWDPGDGLSGPLDSTFETETAQHSAPLPWPAGTQSYSYPSPGIYTATLKLIGDYGTYAQQGNIVVDASTPPTAALALPSTTILAGGSVTFDGTGSSPAPDAGSSITNYHWNFGDGNSDDTGVVASDTHTYTTPGTYIATLTVRQNDQQVSAPATETVTVIAGPPTAAATSSPATATTNQGITFDASGSAPGNGSSIAGYSWDFGDGNTGSGQTASHAYGSAGTYTATVTVTDADGQSAQASTTVVVNTPPPVTTTPSTTSSTPTTTTPSITGSVPTISGKAAIGLTLTGTPNSWTAGASLTYQWYAGGAAIAGATSSTLTLTAAEVGKQVTLKVTGTLSGQTATETSLPTGVVTGKTLKAASPKITGTTKVGKTLKVKTGTWTKGTKFSYQWLAGGKAIKKATKSSLKLAKAEKGKKITVKVTGTLFGYTLVTKTSAATKKVAS